MKKGQMAEGVVEKVEFPNKGIVCVEETGEDGTTSICRVSVKGVIPGQRVRISLKKVRREMSQGILREVLERSPLECMKAECPYYGTCGGCNYQGIPYEKQLELKKEQVLAQLRPVCEGHSDFQFDGILPSPAQWEYRNKMEFSFGDERKDGPLTLGLHRRGSFHDILHVSGCRIIHGDFSLILDCVRDYCAQQGICYYKKTSHEGVLRHLLVRRAEKTKELLVALVTSSQYQQKEMERHLQNISVRLQQLPLSGRLIGFLHIVNDSLGDVVKSDAARTVYGQDWFMEEIMGLSFRITPFSFFQTNTGGAEVLYECVRKYLCANVKEADFSDRTIFDLYTGTGTIAQVLAPIAGRVIGVEIVEEAVAAARENAARNGLDNCEFIAGDVLKVVDELSCKPDYIVLDPPRDGIHPKALPKIIGYGVPEIVYISCKPTSLARDLVEFQRCGYQVQRVCCVDMFPQTVHVESVCLLHRRDKANL